jgi:N-acetylneuraminic acid mutarotase
MRVLLILSLFIFLLLSACSKKVSSFVVTDMPQAVSNNAVALVKNSNGIELYSFNGLSSGKTYKDIHNYVYQWKNGSWKQIKSPKNAKPVLASTAVTIGMKVYLIGGYTVAKDHSEVSTPEIFVFDTVSQSWSLETLMPTPVDDTVALVYDDRYIYLVSGWFDKDNVSLVQVYDTIDKKWEQASEYPAPAVFGHAGGIVNNKMIVCDGVKVVNFDNKPREFHPSPVCMLGVINSSNHLLIDWKEISHHSGIGLYRMAAIADDSQRVVFAGGSDNPYNFNGIGYNKTPSEPSSRVFSYDFKQSKWNESNVKIEANMDHRSLLFDGEYFYILGGMLESQSVTNKVIRFKYE